MLRHQIIHVLEAHVHKCAVDLTWRLSLVYKSPLRRASAFASARISPTVTGELAVLRLNQSGTDHLDLARFTDEIVNHIALAGEFFALDLCTEPFVIRRCE